jgi:FlaA1/EpsC-like NDP-sugar epimerase
VLIYDLAERMIRLSGRKPHTDIEIRITGSRPGEKLTEELTALDELTTPTIHPSIRRVATRAIPGDDLDAGVVVLGDLARELDSEACRQALRSLAAADRPDGLIAGPGAAEAEGGVVEVAPGDGR